MSNLPRILSQLNPCQQEAVVYNQGPLLILAGAGSGKTRALTHKVAYLIKEKSALPENILLVTFTNRAANEMKERIKKLLGSTKIPFAGTFHSFCSRLLRREGKHLGIGPNFVIYDERDQQETIKQAMIKIDISPKKFNPTSILGTISQAKNELINPSEYAQYARGPFQKTVAQIYPAYQNLLREYQALDFDDLLSEAVRLFQKEKRVLADYQNKFRYLLVDEYQDTNRAQYQLTRQLAGQWRNLCVVGDVSQSIYSWRGADYRNVLNLKKDFPDLKIIHLEQNYRSTKTILKAANQVIVKNTSHPILTLWTKNPQGKKIIIYQGESELNEAFFVISTIRSFTSGPNPLPLSCFAVLYRTNAQSRVFEETFLHAGLPHLLIGGVRFYERKEIKDCLAYLKLINNSADLVSFKRAQKLGKRRLDRFFEFAAKIKKKDFSTLELLDQILEVTGYEKLYEGKKEENLSRLENIKELRSVAAEFPHLGAFLENVALIQRESLPQNSSQFQPKADQPLADAPNEREVVTLMTAHSAKGTEFPIIFLVGMEEGLFPHSRALVEKEELEEERRLCYVGMTRAKQRLYLTCAQRRLFFGQRVSHSISRFIKDIPDDLVEWIGKNDTMEL